MYENPHPASPNSPFGFAAPATHQFNDYERSVFREVAENIQFFSIAWILLGALGAVGGIFQILGRGVSGVPTVVMSLGLLLQGMFVRMAQARFQSVGHMSGDDMHETVEGLSSLKRYYFTMAVAGALNIAATLVTMVFGVVGR